MSSVDRVFSVNVAHDKECIVLVLDDRDLMDRSVSPEADIFALIVSVSWLP